MDESQIPLPIILAELLRIQRWAGGDGVSAGRILGLMHGFESVIRQENKSFGIAEETQRKVEDLLEDVDHDKQSSDGMAIKDRLLRDGVDETNAATIMELCRLQGRFGPAIDKVVHGKGSTFGHLRQSRSPEQDWFGSLHYMELFDCTEDARKKMYAVYAPTVPRVGEIVSPQSGSTMRVIGVDHVVIDQGQQQGLPQHYLVPHVLLGATDVDES
ncbi:MAG: hypothetical protein KDA54_13005 [Phycisphaerales bacterium]|nr:hypothetical protein [Phycisphaerales bacterium]